MMYKLRTLLYRLSLKAVVRPPKQYIVLQERAKAPGFSTNQVPGEGGRGGWNKPTPFGRCLHHITARVDNIVWS